MTDLREGMAKAIKDQMLALSRLRGCSQTDALSWMITTFKENSGSTMSSYWLLMVDVAQHEVVPA